MDQKIDTEIFRNVERLKQLRVEHQDLDQVISRLVNDPQVDQIMLRRLKKRKLMLKDMITQLESARIPDLNA
ncbi:MAG TPA: YdcH family protein [Gammaproteobacteria bacterium]|nr:YdcH family protein [Gammaproteobacteria bacterium]